MQTMPSLVCRPSVFLNSFLLKLNKNMGAEGAAGNLLFVLLKCCISQQSSSFSAWRYCYIRTTVGLTQFSICRQMDVLCWGLSTEDCETTNYNPAAFSYLDFFFFLPCSQLKVQLEWEKQTQAQSQKGPWQCRRSCPCLWMLHLDGIG